MMYRYLPYFLRYDTYLWRNKNKSCATTLLWQGNTSSEQLRLKISHQIVDRVDMVLQRGRPVEGQQTEAALEQVGGHKVPSHQVRLVITYNKSIYKSWQKLHLNRLGGHKVPDHQVRLVIVKKQKQMRSGYTQKPNNSIATADVPYV